MNSWPSTTGPETPLFGCRVVSGVRTGPAAYSVASVPQSPTRTTRSVTSPGPGGSGLGAVLDPGVAGRVENQAPSPALPFSMWTLTFSLGPARGVVGVGRRVQREPAR